MAESTKRQRMDKIRRPSLQDGVGRLTRFSPRDDNGKVASVASSAPDLSAEPLASLGWALTAAPGILISRCRAAVQNI
jgi:hypothetical protein